MDKFEITGPGEYRTREGKKATVTVIRDYGQWPARGLIYVEAVAFTADSAWRLNGEWEVEPGRECKYDIVGPWAEGEVVDAEFVAPEFVELPNAGAVGVDLSGASLRPTGPTIREVIEHERAETAAFESATEEANRHAFAALRALTRALNRHGIAPGSEVADAHAFALLVLDGFAP